MGVNTKRTSQRIRKSTAGVRKIKYRWKEHEVCRLIAAVEQRRGLWDYSSSEYKQSKNEGWKDVVDELGIDGVDVDEVKIKWSSLRVTFRVNFLKAQDKVSTPGQPVEIPWKFYKKMMFLDINNRTKSPLLLSMVDSKLCLDHLDADQLRSTSSQATVEGRKRLFRTVTPTNSLSLSTSSCNEAEVSTCDNPPALESADIISGYKDKSITFSPSPSPPLISIFKEETDTLSNSPEAVSLDIESNSCDKRKLIPEPATSIDTAKEHVELTLTNPATPTTLQTVDANSACCDNLLSELRTLPDSKARTLRRLLTRTLYDFMDACESETAEPSSIQFTAKRKSP